MNALLKKVCLVFLGGALTGPLLGQSSSFTYQGRLLSDGAMANGSYQLQFRLFGSALEDTPVSGFITNSSVSVSNGLFTCGLDFGPNAFDGGARWLEMGVRPQGSGAAFVLLSPRQSITVAPYAIRAASAGQLAGTISAANIPAGTITGAMLSSGVGPTLTDLNATQLTMGVVPGAALDKAWKRTGNGATSPGTDFVGTTDNQPLELKVNAQRALRLEYVTGEMGPTINLIGGYQGNAVSNSVIGGTVAGGGVVSEENRVNGDYGTVGGGRGNHVATGATVSGGVANMAIEDAAAIGGGEFNTASGGRATVGGGIFNLATQYGAVVGGGGDNVASGVTATIGGGNVNTASGSYATVGGGTFNRATASGASVAGGQQNHASGDFGTIPGGLGNVAVSYALAAGYHALANHPGSFVWADYTDGNFASTSSNQFLIRASGGVGIGTSGPSGVLHAKAGANGGAPVLERGPVNTDLDWVAARVRVTRAGDMQDGLGGGLSFELVDDTTLANAAYIGARREGGSDNTTALIFQTANGGPPTTKMTLDRAGNLVTTGAINPPSDRNVKQDFVPANAREILERVVKLPVYSWAYTNDVQVRHLGPVAQDFSAAFGLGHDDKHIATVDADGVALVAIQGLNQKLSSQLKEKEEEIAELRERLLRLEKLVGLREPLP